MNLLSAAGRAELIKCVLHNIVSFWMYTFKLSDSILKELERIFSNFSLEWQATWLGMEWCLQI